MIRSARPARSMRSFAPSGADLEQVLARGERELAARGVELRGRGLEEGRVRPGEDGAGIGHGFVEEQPEEPVAEIVMRGDVAAAAGLVVAVQAVGEGAQRRGEARPAGIDLVHQVAIDHHQAHQGGEVVALPVAVDVRPARAHRAGEHRVRIEPRIAHPDGDVEGALGRDPAEGFVAGAVDQAQPAVADAPHLQPQQRPCKARQRRDAFRGCAGVFGRNDVRFHVGSG